MNERKESTTSIILEYVRVIVLTVIATFIFLQFVQISRVNGSSMENTYFQNDKVFYKHSQPKRNDIIIVDYDDGLDDTLIIKRVIAVGGDHLDIKNNEVYINGKKIKENYIKI
jgi:signal peptidase I